MTLDPLSLSSVSRLTREPHVSSRPSATAANDFDSRPHIGEDGPRGVQRVEVDLESSLPILGIRARRGKPVSKLTIALTK